MSGGVFLAVFGAPCFLACAALAWLILRIKGGLLALAVGLGGWAAITVIMSLLSYNLIQ